MTELGLHRPIVLPFLAMLVPACVFVLGSFQTPAMADSLAVTSISQAGEQDAAAEPGSSGPREPGAAADPASPHAPGSAADPGAGQGADAGILAVEALQGPAAAGEHSAILVGETLNYAVRWGVVPAGTATMAITESRVVSDHPCLHVVATALSNPVFDKVYAVRDQFESFMDAGDLRSWAFKKHLREGKFRRDQVVRKDHAAGKAYYHDGQAYDLTPGAYDVLSAFYYVRTLPLRDGDEYYLDSHSDKKNYAIKVQVHGRERVTVPAGTFDCVMVEPTLRSGDFFKNEGSLFIWLTDDERRMPVQMKSKIPVGSIAVELEGFERPETRRTGGGQ